MDADDRRAHARAEAAQWLLLTQPGGLSHEQRRALVAWLRESPVHVEEMLRVARVHKELVNFDRWDEISTQGAVPANVVEFPAPPVEPPVERSRRTPRRWMAASAASVVVLTAAALLLLNFGTQAIDTQRGERREFALSDGSVVLVDPETRLRVKLEERAREIVLMQGRALFRVAKDPNRPFRVHADDTVVRAVGTTFAVERQQEGVRVTVAEGRVAIEPPATDQATELQTAPVLSANEQVTVKRSGTAATVRKIDARRELAWAEGQLDFKDETLESAVAQFNRYNSVQLRIVDPSLRTRRVSGIFKATDPESFAAFLGTTTAAEVSRRSGDEIVLDSRR